MLGSAYGLESWYFQIDVVRYFTSMLFWLRKIVERPSSTGCSYLLPFLLRIGKGWLGAGSLLIVFHNWLSISWHIKSWLVVERCANNDRFQSIKFICSLVWQNLNTSTFYIELFGYYHSGKLGLYLHQFGYCTILYDSMVMYHHDLSIIIYWCAL